MKKKARRSTPASKKKAKKQKEAHDHFVKGVLTREEAVSEGADHLPPGVTHEIVKDKDGNVILKRKRFSIN